VTHRVRWWTAQQVVRVVALRSAATGALAVGGVAVGSGAAGALSGGALTVGRLALRRGEVEDLRIARLHSGELTLDRPLRGNGAGPRPPED
jgi:hypothetical protein